MRILSTSYLKRVLLYLKKSSINYKIFPTLYRSDNSIAILAMILEVYTIVVGS